MVMEENNLKFSARLVHSFLCKELVTSKRHEKWFTFARRPLRFGLQEYHAVTGLKVKQEKNSRFVKWKDDDGFWSTQIKTSGKISLQSIKKKYLEESSTWTWVDRVRLVYLCVIMGVMFGRDEKVNIPLLYMKLVMDLDKLRNYPWGLHSFNFLLKQINKTRDKLEQTEGYLMERFLFGFQIWIMEAIPALGEICGTKISDKFTGPRCSNWTGCARCSYQDIINVETLFPANGILHSFMEFHGNGVVLLPTDFAVKDEKKDERVDRILDMIERKHDWSNHVWGVEKVTSSGFEESDEEEGEEGQEGQEGEEGEEQAADTEIGESSHVAENVNITADVSGKNKRKHADRGAESRKKKVLCQLAASSKGNIDTDMKKFLEGLVQASFMTFEEKFSNIFDNFETVVSDRLGKIETEVTRLRTSSDRSDKFETVVIDRLGNIEAEITQLRTTLLVTELAEKTDQPSGPSKSNIDTSPSTSKKDTVPSKKKAVKKKELKSSQSSAIVNLPPVNLSQSSAIDLRLGTQDFLESCMKNLSQDTFVKGFDPTQVKAEDSLDWLEPPTSLKMSPRRFNDRDIELAGADEPDSCLVYVRKEDFEKMLKWQDTRTSIQIGPSVLDEKLAACVIGPTKWLQNNEIDAVMYVFRERTTLQRWKVDRVAFMTCVFSDLNTTDYKHFLDGIKNYKMDPLLLEYGKGEFPSHGRTRKLWNVDVDRMYVPVWVNRNHWIALCISFVTRNIQVFDCSGRKSIKEGEAFTKLIPRIVKAVQSPTIRKHLAVTPYSVSIVPMSDLNQLNFHCGVYMLKHIECHVLGLDISLVNDDNIREARIKTMWDLWEAATDPELIERMSKYEPPKCKPAECIEL
ncbi:hypothetical protein Bca101_083344 [Brassica carinata]